MKTLKKDEGFIQYVLAIMVICIIALISLYMVKMRTIEIQKQEVEDAITASALASAIVDINEYGTYNYIRSNDGHGSGTLAGSSNEWSSSETNLLNIFKENLMTNLGLEYRYINGIQTMMPKESNKIISGPVTITKFYIYNHELEDGDETGTRKKIKDYRGNWVQQHHETDRFYVYKYEATNGGYNTTSDLCIKEADGKIYTPRDDNMISIDGSTATDAVGGGHVEVDTMTIYASIDFYIRPFGSEVENWGLLSDKEIETNYIKVTKSVVVTVQQV